MLIGLRVAAGALLGAVAGWAIAAPLLLRHGIVAHAEYEALTSWLTWPAVGLMIGEAAGSLAGQLGHFLRAARDLIGGEGTRGELEQRTVRRGVAIVVLAAIAIVALGWWVFRLHPLLTIGVLALSVFLAAVCARVAGQTDVALLGPMGQITQLVHGLLGGGSAAANLAAASIPAGDAAQTTQILWSLPGGSLLGASRSRQVRAPLLGILLGAAVTGPAYALLVRAHRIGSQALPAPAARTFKAVGEAVIHGTAGLPPHAL